MLGVHAMGAEDGEARIFVTNSHICVKAYNPECMSSYVYDVLGAHVCVNTHSKHVASCMCVATNIHTLHTHVYVNLHSIPQ